MTLFVILLTERTHGVVQAAKKQSGQVHVIRSAVMTVQTLRAAVLNAALLLFT